ncbi:CPBP family intramembrane glutamic endopeptidase [Gryllotalpicola ginsengisoli]|uniref:CPBP family intramembrane glutamic endopeptidase n=1 Tax=Gryllotalpicola ginsengisoli TaxID=444608 RepID=UPI0003B44BCA|nr:type II CAAX endopeptidase family protein [Gryllotalpicola ginsengisoli]
MTDASRARPALWWSVGALIVAVGLALGYQGNHVGLPYALQVTLSYALTWGPLVVALLVNWRFWAARFRFRWPDVALGIAVGIVTRAVGILITYSSTGRLASGSVIFGHIDFVFVFTTALAPVILAPLIEEPFFRGLLQTSLLRYLPGWAAIAVASVAFTLVHTIANGWSSTLLITLLVYAIGAGYVTLRTGRLGAAIIAHAVFNGLAALISWPWGV